MMSAYFKIPLQFLIPMIGVLIFVFYLFHQPPVLSTGQHDAEVRASARAGEYRVMEQEFTAAFEARRDAATALAAARRSDGAGALEAPGAAFRDADGRVAAIRERATAARPRGDGRRDIRRRELRVPTFVTERMPVGLVGLIIAAFSRRRCRASRPS